MTAYPLMKFGPVSELSFDQLEGWVERIEKRLEKTCDPEIAREYRFRLGEIDLEMRRRNRARRRRLFAGG